MRQFNAVAQNKCLSGKTDLHPSPLMTGTCIAACETWPYSTRSWLRTHCNVSLDTNLESHPSQRPVCLQPISSRGSWAGNAPTLAKRDSLYTHMHEQYNETLTLIREVWVKILLASQLLFEIIHNLLIHLDFKCNYKQTSRISNMIEINDVTSYFILRGIFEHAPSSD